MNRYYPKQVNPKTMTTHFREIFRFPIGLKKPSFRNLLLIILAVCTAKTFRTNEIASLLPLDVKTEKSKQKRLLRFLDTPLPIYHCYKRRMRIEHGFRDIKARFGFGELVLKKLTHQRVAVL